MGTDARSHVIMAGARASEIDDHGPSGDDEDEDEDEDEDVDDEVDD